MTRAFLASLALVTACAVATSGVANVADAGPQPRYEVHVFDTNGARVVPGPIPGIDPTSLALGAHSIYFTDEHGLAAYPID